MPTWMRQPMPPERHRQQVLFRRLLPASVILFGSGWLTPAGLGQESTGAPVQFDRDIAPVLSASCTGCHNDRTRTSGLSLQSPEGILAGGNRGAAVEAGRPDDSRLIQALTHSGDLKMPPAGKLPAEQIALLRRWVALGLPGMKAAKASTARRGSDHWSFQPIVRPAEPAVQKHWTRNAIDSFILHRLQKEGVQPAQEADKITLLRRLSLDIIGLPPAPAEIDAFLSDKRPDAYERQVERLLASPHYGERWGRHWLDYARYADSHGYSGDGPREIWKYRDWVIQAFNNDMPFDQFVVEQIAGDLLPSPTANQLIATGLHRNTLIQLEGGEDFEQYRVEAVVDRVDTTGAVFLGLTLGCARCHDHKFDPISQREFYQFYAFFNNIDELAPGVDREKAREPLLELGTKEEFGRRDAFRAQLSVVKKEFEEYEKALLDKQPEWERSLGPNERERYDADVRTILQIAAEKRDERQKRRLRTEYLKTDPAYGERQKNLAEMGNLEPPIVSTLIMRDLPKPREAYIHLGGDFVRKGAPVSPGVLGVLHAWSPGEAPNRLDLARWLTDPKNPLTPRVTVNRIWQEYFGKGLVETENDFGTQGSPPSHPELLDWLAAEFLARGGRQKAMHRLIVTSAAYRQSSNERPELQQRDPGNRLLARQTRLRLDAEVVRDAALTASGLLTATVGGPSVFPPQPAGALSKEYNSRREWNTSVGPDRYRRGMYTFFYRSSPHPSLTAFDAPAAVTTCTRRMRSNTPLQALTLLNDSGHHEFARALAARVLKEGLLTDAARIDYAFRLCLARHPSEREQSKLGAFLAGQLDHFQQRPREAWAILGAIPAEGTDVIRLAGWTATARVLLNLDEFITRE